MYGIVRQSGGGIVVETELGRGTRFTIHLPCAADAAIEPRRASSTVTSESGKGTVLLVEDQDDLRDSLAVALEMFGYEVLVAATPEEALEIARREGDRVRAMITDVVMPDTSGPDLARDVRAVATGTQVVFMSGYAPERVIRADLAADAVFLQKPFMPQELVRALGELLRR